MQTATIKAETREKAGATALRRLRKRGLVPGVIYGHKETPELVALDGHDLDGALEQHARLIKLQLEGGERQYLLKDVQFCHLQKDPLHVDLMRVDADERVTVEVSLDFRGEPNGVREGGKLNKPLAAIEIECPVLEIPDSLRVDIAHLEIGDSIHVSDIALPAGAVAVSGADEVVVTVSAPRAEVEPTAAAEDEASAEPEVIGRGKEEESDEG